MTKKELNERITIKEEIERQKHNNRLKLLESIRDNNLEQVKECLKFELGM